MKLVKRCFIFSREIVLHQKMPASRSSIPSYEAAHTQRTPTEACKHNLAITSAASGRLSRNALVLRSGFTLSDPTVPSEILVYFLLFADSRALILLQLWSTEASPSCGIVSTRPLGISCMLLQLLMCHGICIPCGVNTVRFCCVSMHRYTFLRESFLLMSCLCLQG